MLMCAVIPVLTVVLAWLWVLARWPGYGRRGAGVIAWTLGGVWVVAGTELLSLVNGIRFRPVLIWWLVPCAAVAVDLAMRGRWRQAAGAMVRRPGGRMGVAGWGMAGLLGAVVVGSGLCATLSPPNNFDSMSYHMSRQVIWLQQRNVRHWPTAEVRQVEMPPLTEFASLHLTALSGGDRWSNLVQWSALLVMIAGVSLAAREMGGPRRVQLLAGVLAAGIPMAFLQASSTKNDLVLAALACAVLWWGVRAWRRRSCPWAEAGLAVAGVGLAVMTKGTAYAILPGPCALLGAAWWRAYGLGSAGVWGRGALAVAVVAGLNAGHMLRNYGFFGNPLGPSGALYNNAVHTPAAVASNVVRNLALHAPVAGARGTEAVRGWVAGLHRWLGISASDPRTTWLSMPFDMEYAAGHEDTAGAPVQVLLAMLAVPAGLLLARRGMRHPGLVAATAGCGYAAFVAFCVLLKWQPWHARLHLPILAILAAPTACALGAARWSRWVAGVAVAGVAVVLVPCLWNDRRPLVGEGNIFTSTAQELRFHARPDLLEVTRQVVAAVRGTGLSRVALRTRQWDYPMERMLLDELGRRVTFVPYNPTWGGSRMGAYPPPDVLVVETAWKGRQVGSVGGEVYDLVAQYLPYTIYCRSALSRRVAAARRRFGRTVQFAGWSTVEGASEPEGPWEGTRSMKICWGYAPQTRLTYWSDGDQAMDLVMECPGPYFLPEQVMTIRVNGEVVGEQRGRPAGAAGEWIVLRLPVQVRAGSNDVTVEYARSEPYGSNLRGAMFARLLLVPRVVRASAAGTGSRPE